MRKQRALVLVHLSTLDLYAERVGLEQAYSLAARLREAILSWDGPVFVIDQRWPKKKWSEPRWNLVLEVQLQRDIEWTFFDEWRDDWEEFMVGFRARLIRAGIKEVVLGGVWYDPGSGAGAVGDLAEMLKRYMKVSVDHDLVGTISEAA